MIPTKYKAKLSKALSWPLRAQAISDGLTDVPHVDELTLSFHAWGVASHLQRPTELTPYTVLTVRYKAAHRPGYSASSQMVEAGWYDSKWELTVYPVPRQLRAVAGSVLRTAGLPAVAEWLRSSGRSGWTARDHQLELVFNPSDGTLTPRATDGA